MPSSPLARVWGLIWRATLIALAYSLGLIVAGGLAATFGWSLPTTTENALEFAVLGGACIGFTLVLIFQQTSWSSRSRFAIGVCAVVFTMLSTTIEGSLFAPTLVGSLPALVLLDLLAALAVGGMAMLGSTPAAAAGPAQAFSWSMRPWHSWAWRFALSGGSYLVFYWLYGALNYVLVTHPYYASHHNALQVPSAQTLLAAEAVRAPLLVLAVMPLVLTASLTRRQLAICGAATLFIIGGVVPLLHQAGALPMFLLVASGWEIFLQNVSLALVIAWLFGRKSPAATGATMHSRSACREAPSAAP
jgi:hypothetical protein